MIVLLTKQALKLQGEGYRLQAMRQLAREVAAKELRSRLSKYSYTCGRIRAILRD
jgi:hypothetical protein